MKGRATSTNQEVRQKAAKVKLIQDAPGAAQEDAKVQYNIGVRILEKNPGLEGADAILNAEPGQQHPESRTQARPEGHRNSRTFLPRGLEVKRGKKEKGNQKALTEYYTGPVMTVTLTGELKHDGVTYEEGATVELPTALVQRKYWLTEAGRAMDLEQTRIIYGAGLEDDVVYRKRDSMTPKG